MAPPHRGPAAYAVGTIAEAYRELPPYRPGASRHGLQHHQIRDLEETINAADCDLVLFATPIQLTRLVTINKPTLRVRYEYRDHGEPTLGSAAEAARDPEGSRERSSSRGVATSWMTTTAKEILLVALGGNALIRKDQRGHRAGAVRKPEDSHPPDRPPFQTLPDHHHPRQRTPGRKPPAPAGMLQRGAAAAPGNPCLPRRRARSAT